MEPNSEYIDVLERTIYNGIISGLNLNGDRFFYSNRLAALPKEIEANPHGFSLQRQPWFDVACCPTNIVRFLPSIPGFIYSKNNAGVSINLYIQSSVVINFKDAEVKINQKNTQPWDDKCTIEIDSQYEKDIKLYLRIPHWSKRIKVKINNKLQKVSILKGYASVSIPANKKSKLDVDLGMDINIIKSNPDVRQNFGKLAVQRGPIVYCMEEHDNGPDLHKILINKKSLEAKNGLLNNYKYTFISGIGKKAEKSDWNKKLYLKDTVEKYKRKKIKLIPYFLWANRKVGEMKVWFEN